MRKCGHLHLFFQLDVYFHSAKQCMYCLSVCAPTHKGTLPIIIERNRLSTDCLGDSRVNIALKIECTYPRVVGNT